MTGMRLGATALFAVACGAAPIAAPAPREALPATQIPVAPAPEPELPAVGALERPGALARFFKALGRLEKGEATDDVRITQLGDSHTSSDWETGPARRLLQTRFGDGGRGFVAIGLPWKAWSQEGVLAGMAGEWMPQMSNVGARRPTGEGVFGLSGAAVASRQGGARAWIDVLLAASRAELYYLEQPSGGSFDLVVDGRTTRVASRTEQRRSAFRTIDLAEAPRHHIEVHPVGDGEVRLFGLSLDRSEQHGLVLDALGINGARATMMLSWSEAHWTEQIRHRAPQLVIVAYGTNEAMDVETPPEAFEADVAEAVARVARAMPSAACLVLGPPDRAKLSGTTWTTPPRLLEIIARERRVAERGGCAFYDRMAAMGGAGAMARWAADGSRGQQDRVHLTREGYAEVGASFAGDLVRAYDLWRDGAAKSRAIAADPAGMWESPSQHEWK